MFLKGIIIHQDFMKRLKDHSSCSKKDPPPPFGLLRMHFDIVCL